jgi:hypothetical protein
VCHSGKEVVDLSGPEDQSKKYEEFSYRGVVIKKTNSYL